MQDGFIFVKYLDMLVKRGVPIFQINAGIFVYDLDFYLFYSLNQCASHLQIKR
jgi:hypothetical protein